MTTVNRVMTADELLRMPSDNLRHELVNGELKTMAPAGFDHSAVGVMIASIFLAHVKRHELGIVVGADAGFVLRRNPDTVRAPDAAFISASRVGAGPRTTKFWEGAPDLAVEVLSPGDTVQEVEEKVDEYLAAGTQMVLVANPRRKTITVHRPKAQPVVLREADILDTSPVIAGLNFQVGEAFG